MKKRLIKIIMAAVLFIIGVIMPKSLFLMKNAILLVAYIIVGYDILKKALGNIMKGEIFDENFLMAIATLGAFCLNEFPEAVAVMLFYQIGELFQSYAVTSSRKSIASLMDIRPDYANVYRDAKVIKVDPNEVNIDEVIVVSPGEKIPLDGIIIEGESMLDTHSLTGESVPQKVKVGESVLSGCINVSGVIKIKVQKEFGESTVSKILELVENASSCKAKSENFIAKFAKVYTPIVVIIAIFLASIPPILLHDAHFSEWLYRALSFLVVSCPCALVISIPLSFFAGIGAASKMGVLVKGSNYLEQLAKTKIVVLDKTGTLTEGVFEVQQIDAVDISADELLKYATYAECYSHHPISLSLKKAYNKKIDTQVISNVQEISGQGVIALVNGKQVLVGNEKLMTEKAINYKSNTQVGTICYVAIDKHFCGSILIADKIKDDSYKAIQMLKKYGIKRFVMLTGDRQNIASDVAQKLDINEYYYELLPDAKVVKVDELLKEKSHNDSLVFVGDGINDAPVLTMADIGISMGGIGSDAAIEASDIVLMTDELSKIAKTINIAKKTLRIVKENIWFAISVKVCILLLSAFGMATMWEAVFADVGVSVIAILNALRILKASKKD